MVLTKDPAQVALLPGQTYLSQVHQDLPK
jgi:hypothetical protein